MTLNPNEYKDQHEDPYDDEDELPEHVCPFEEGHEDVDTEPGAGPWKLYVADRSGTYLGLSELRVVALTAAEDEELDLGSEHVLDECYGLPLVELLRETLDSYSNLEWT